MKNNHVLIIGRCRDGFPSSAFLSCVGAAKRLDDTVIALAHTSEDASAFAAVAGVTRVLLAPIDNMPFPIAERISAAAVAALNHTPCRFIIAPANTSGKDTLPRIAALCDAEALSDVIEIIDATHIRRPCFAGNIIESITIDDTAPCVAMTIRPSAFERASVAGGGAEIITVDYTESADISAPVYIETITQDSDLPDPLTAKRVISGGRGAGSQDGFKTVSSFAEALGECAVGASRAAVDAGYATNDMQVGQTGKIVAPNLYIAAGISGAIQHQAGIKDSGIIVAINTDENAPIFDIADIGLVADMFDALPEWEALVKKDS